MDVSQLPLFVSLFRMAFRCIVQFRYHGIATDWRLYHHSSFSLPPVISLLDVATHTYVEFGSALSIEGRRIIKRAFARPNPSCFVLAVFYFFAGVAEHSSANTKDLCQGIINHSASTILITYYE